MRSCTLRVCLLLDAVLLCFVTKHLRLFSFDARPLTSHPPFPSLHPPTPATRTPLLPTPTHGLRRGLVRVRTAATRARRLCAWRRAPLAPAVHALALRSLARRAVTPLILQRQRRVAHHWTATGLQAEHSCAAHAARLAGLMVRVLAEAFHNLISKLNTQLL